MATKKLIIQYSIVKNGILNHFLKQVTEKKYNDLYKGNPIVLNLEILPITV